MKGNLFRELSPDFVIEDLEAMAKSMVGKPITVAGFEIGEIISAVVVGDHIEWDGLLKYERMFSEEAKERAKRMGCEECWQDGEKCGYNCPDYHR